jgi:hypothetical protein
MANDLIADLGEMTFTIEIKRKATGLTESHEVKGFLSEAQLNALMSEALTNGSNTQHSSAERSD